MNHEKELKNTVEQFVESKKAWAKTNPNNVTAKKILEIISDSKKTKLESVLRDAIEFGYNHGKGDMPLEYIIKAYLKENLDNFHHHFLTIDGI
jgi:hypothetical protein